MLPEINLLIRVSRPDLFMRCLETILEQNYPKLRLIVSLDDINKAEAVVDSLVDAFQFFDVNTTVIPVTRNSGADHYWNLYCNDLKSHVTSGWFFYLDDDDELAPNGLHGLAKHLTDPSTGIICQFLRNGKPKPSNLYIDQKLIKLGAIGGGCIVLHHTHKDLAYWDDQRAADFRFIRDVSQKLPLKFIHHILQITTNNGRHGK